MDAARAGAAAFVAGVLALTVAVLLGVAGSLAMAIGAAAMLAVAYRLDRDLVASRPRSPMEAGAAVILVLGIATVVLAVGRNINGAALAVYLGGSAAIMLLAIVRTRATRH